MNFLISPNAFKGTLSASEASSLIEKSIREVLPDSGINVLPIADGGDGTCELLIDHLGLEKVTFWSLNAVGQPILGHFGWDEKEKIAYLDVSTFSGLAVLHDFQKDPKTTSTFGTGLAIQKAIANGAQEIVLGLGGSATVDLGTGILGAMGFLFLDQKGRELHMFAPDLIKRTKFIQQPLKIPKVKFTCLCDVKNTFFGERGAVRVFGPQKGLKKDDLLDFEAQHRELVELMKKKTGKVWKDRSGFGAAGGIALGIDFFFETELNYGSYYFFEKVKLKEKLKSIDWIITGEGRYDDQSSDGKACFELFKLAKQNGKKIALITSGTEGQSAGFELVLTLPDLDFSDPLLKNKASENLQRLVNSALREGYFY
ncbi:MAG: glycerate kinase [Algoriphagus sp.]|jgi:glycerate kinase|nr:glycerate kinase [Algoriphagus sp.]